MISQNKPKGMRAALSAVALALLASGCQATVERGCTNELGIHIEPRRVTLEVGRGVRATAETSTCGGSIREVPTGLEWESRDPMVASVDRQTGEIIGVAPGSTLIDVNAGRLGNLGTVDVLVVDR